MQPVPVQRSSRRISGGSLCALRSNVTRYETEAAVSCLSVALAIAHPALSVTKARTSGSAHRACSALRGCQRTRCRGCTATASPTPGPGSVASASRPSPACHLVAPAPARPSLHARAAIAARFAPRAGRDRAPAEPAAAGLWHALCGGVRSGSVAFRGWWAHVGVDRQLY
jgi:hypothetical protein